MVGPLLHGVGKLCCLGSTLVVGRIRLVYLGRVELPKKKKNGRSVSEKERLCKKSYLVAVGRNEAKRFLVCRKLIKLRVRRHVIEVDAFRGHRLVIPRHEFALVVAATVADGSVRLVIYAHFE